MELTVIALADRSQTEAGAYALLEEIRWGESPTCPHCGSARVYFLTPSNGISRATRTGSVSERRVWKCGSCRRQFTALVGTTLQGTKISLRKWLFVVFEMCSARNGISAPEIERRYHLSAKSARSLTRRIREATHLPLPPGDDARISLPLDPEAALRALLRAGQGEADLDPQPSSSSSRPANRSYSFSSSTVSGQSDR